MRSPIVTFVFGMITAAFLISITVETGLIRKAHALTVNVGVRLIKESISESEARIIGQINASCTAPKAGG